MKLDHVKLCMLLCMTRVIVHVSGDDDITEHVSHFISEHVKNDECRNHSLRLLQGFVDLEMWAVKMIDSSAKLQSGILEGNIKNLGQYDECLGVNAPSFSGQYCLASVQVTSSVRASSRSLALLQAATLGRLYKEIIPNRSDVIFPELVPSFSAMQLAVCVPSSCSWHEVEAVLNAAMQNVARYAGLEVSAHLMPSACTTSLHLAPAWTLTELTLGCVLLLLILLTIFGTLYEIHFKEVSDIGTGPRVLAAFSVRTNWRRLCSSSKEIVGKEKYACLDGVRVLTTLWVIIGHEVMLLPRMPSLNQSSVPVEIKSVLNMPFMNYVPTVDTFFVMSGMLRALSFFKDMDQGKYSFGSTMLQRYLRLTPVFAVMIIVTVTIVPRLSSGPLWYDYSGRHAEACKDTWLPSLLYLHNYLNTNNMCLGHTWSTAADMQMHLLSPLLLYPIWRWPQFATLLFVVAMTTSILTSLVQVVVNNGLAVVSLGAHDSKIFEYIFNNYYVTHHRAGPFIIGLALGYIFYYHHHKFNISQVKVYAGWLCSLIVFTVVVFAPYEMHQFDYEYNVVEAAVYGALHRPVWAVAVAWLVFACHTGHGGWINKLLTWRYFQPLSRLSFSVYMSHTFVLIINTGRLRAADYVTTYDMVRLIVLDIEIILIIALVTYLVVEAPASRITSIFFKKDAAPRRSISNGLLNGHAKEEGREFVKEE